LVFPTGLVQGSRALERYFIESLINLLGLDALPWCERPSIYDAQGRATRGYLTGVARVKVPRTAGTVAELPIAPGAMVRQLLHQGDRCRRDA